jgi:glycerophosphoryl diester phosphodiesterase
MRPEHLRNVKGPLIAHRGLFSEAHPENSKEAIMLACKKGYWVEFDVRVCSDEEVVVFHDDTLQRLCGTFEKVCDVPSTQITQLQLLTSSCRVPLLKDVLKSVPRDATLVIELKSFEHGQEFLDNDTLVKRTLATIRDFSGRVLLKSFNPFSVAQLIKINPPSSVGFLSCDHFRDGDFSNTNQPYLQSLQNLDVEAAVRADFISYSINDLTPSLAQKVKSRKQGLMVWTVRNQENQTKAEQWADNQVFEPFTSS